MSDPISDAIEISKLNEAIKNRISITPSINTPTETIEEKLKKLPTTKDPVLLKREKEADVLKNKADEEELKLNTNQLLIDGTKEKLKELTITSVEFPPKLPLIDPKIQQTVVIATQIKNLVQQRKKVSKENLTKGKEVYSFPLVPKKS